MIAKHARIHQKILNHIKWRFQFPSLLSILRVLNWHLVGFTLIERQLLTCFTHSILFRVNLPRLKSQIAKVRCNHKQPLFKNAHLCLASPQSHKSALVLFSTIPFGGLSCLAHSLQDIYPGAILYSLSIWWIDMYGSFSSGKSPFTTLSWVKLCVPIGSTCPVSNHTRQAASSCWQRVPTSEIGVISPS